MLAGGQPGKNASFASKRTQPSAKRRRLDMELEDTQEDDSLTKLCKESRVRTVDRIDENVFL